jgi:hypothetical protein
VNPGATAGGVGVAVTVMGRVGVKVFVIGLGVLVKVTGMTPVEVGVSV